MRALPARDRDEFPMSPDLENFKLEVAQELGLAHRVKEGKKPFATPQSNGLPLPE